jgi:pyruvate dehydrogenase E2 component (dihydrolipoamide acetyltransferase)
MNIEFKLPELGENIASGDIVRVLVRVGDVIVGNQGIAELETDKAVVEIPCPHAGKIVQLLFNQGDKVKVGQTLAIIEPESAAIATAPQAAPHNAAPAAPATVASDVGVSPAPDAISRAEESLIPAGPAARRLARELNVDLGKVQGSGSHGRITPDDVQAAAAMTPSATASAVASSRGESPALAAVPVEAVVPPGEPGSDPWGSVRRERMSQIRRTIAARMSNSSNVIPHVTNFDDADVTDLDQLRKGVPQDFLGKDLKLTMMPLVMRAVALSLRRHPAVNASIDDEKQEIVYKEYVNLGVAVDTPRGLVVPAIRGADRMSIAQLATALADVAKRARASRFTVEDLRGGTFTISNLGALGGTYSTPIINHPEAAILLLGRSRWLPVVRDGQIVPRFMMPLSLSYDHRLIDGATAARFLNEVIGYLQSPGSLLLGG